jgi:hypothetical protein
MKVILTFTVATLFVAIFSLVAIAQQNPGGGPSPAVPQGTEKQLTPEQFAAMKSRILNMIDERRSKLDEEKACVEAALTPAELRKCKRHHRMGPGPQQTPQPSENRQK